MGAFGGIVVAAAAWTIWGGDMFPAQPDAKGDPKTWTREELRRWLAVVRATIYRRRHVPIAAANKHRIQRNLFPGEADTREQLLERVLANMRAPRT